jgi:hypothetical protein
MRRIDQKRFGKFLSDFVDRSGITAPFYLVAISSSNESVVITRHDENSKVVEICRRSVGVGMTSPVVVALVTEDGAHGASARIEIVEAPKPRMQ